MSFYLGKNSRANLYGVNAELFQIVELALTITKVDFGIPRDGGLRTAERQKELFLNKKSMLDGYSKKSMHQKGKAFDVFAYVNGKASWEEKYLTHVATAVLCAASQLKVPLIWGGHWHNFVDMPHFEIKR